MDILQFSQNIDVFRQNDSQGFYIKFIILLGAFTHKKIEISITIEIPRYFVLVQTGRNISLIAERDNSVNRTAHA